MRGGWTAPGSGSPAGCGLEVDEPWRLGEVERLEDGPLAVRRLGALTAGAGGTAERAEVHAVELVAQVAPGVVAGGLGEADEQQRQPAEQDVGADAVLQAVVDGTQLERGLHVPPGALDLEQLLVAEGDVLGRQRGVGRS